MAHSPILEQNRPAGEAAEEERFYEVVNGERRELEPTGVFETALASVLSYYLGQFALPQKLGLVVRETLFVLDAQRNLRRRPDVAFVSYPRWPEDRVPRAEAWDVVPDLAVE